MKLGPDEVAIELWTRIGMPPERIVLPWPSRELLGVGGPGPCGQDSEIFWDWGEEHGCGEPDCAPRARAAIGSSSSGTSSSWRTSSTPTARLTPLPEQNIDTGLGLERGAAILQDVRSVYETDGFQEIMA